MMAPAQNYLNKASDPGRAGSQRRHDPGMVPLAARPCRQPEPPVRAASRRPGRGSPAIRRMRALD